jgi:hypothetical protein
MGLVADVGFFFLLVYSFSKEESTTYQKQATDV